MTLMLQALPARQELAGNRRKCGESPDAVVYYVRIGERIKIGWSSDLARRMQDLMPEEILAVEPGGPAVEQQRKRQFLHLRIIGERFHPGPDLLAHIAEVTRQHGPAAGSCRVERPS